VRYSALSRLLKGGSPFPLAVLVSQSPEYLARRAAQNFTTSILKAVGGNPACCDDRSEQITVMLYIDFLDHK